MLCVDSGDTAIRFFFRKKGFIFFLPVVERKRGCQFGLRPRCSVCSICSASGMERNWLTVGEDVGMDAGFDSLGPEAAKLASFCVKMINSSSVRFRSILGTFLKERMLNDSWMPSGL